MARRTAKFAKDRLDLEAPLFREQLLAPLVQAQLLALLVRNQLLAPLVRDQLLAPPALVALAACQRPHVPGAIAVLQAINRTEEELVSLSLQNGMRMGEDASGRTKWRHTVDSFQVQRRIAGSKE